MSAGAAVESADPGFARLEACLQVIAEDLRALKERVGGNAIPPSEDLTRPLTALELCERWHVAGSTPKAQLYNLARKCRDWGLEPLKGTRGWDALYGRGDVLHAEGFAGGKISRRKHAA